jgi:hypothetical protein
MDYKIFFEFLNLYKLHNVGQALVQAHMSGRIGHKLKVFHFPEYVTIMIFDLVKCFESWYMDL